MFGVHMNEAEGHIHAHAVITVKNESGQKIHPGRDMFSDWRQAYAQPRPGARLEDRCDLRAGTGVVAELRPKDKAIVDAAERPRPARELRDRAYAADRANQSLIDNGRQRIRTARATRSGSPRRSGIGKP